MRIFVQLRRLLVNRERSIETSRERFVLPHPTERTHSPPRPAVNGTAWRGPDMRKILISERPLGGWGFDWGDLPVIEPSRLLAAWQARQFGETLRGQALGYVIRLDVGHRTGELVTLHTEVF